MAVEDVPQDKIINQRKSYFQVLYYIPLRELYRWDDRYSYMAALGYIPVEGQTVPPTLPPGPGSPFNAAETQYLDANYASDAEVQKAISDAGSALGIANTASGDAGRALASADAAQGAAQNAAGAASQANDRAGRAQSSADQAAATATRIEANFGAAVSSFYPDTEGAKGDGVTNDTDAIQKSFDKAKAAGGGYVELGKNKKYFVDGTLTIPTDTTFNLNGSTIFKPFGSSRTLSLTNDVSNGLAGYGNGGKNIRIINGRISGDYTVGLGDITTGWMHVDHLVFENVIFSQGMNNGHYIDLGGCRDVRIINCEFYGMAPMSGREYIEAIQIDVATYSGSSSKREPSTIFDALPTVGVVVDHCHFGSITVGGTAYATPNCIGAHSAGLTDNESGYYRNIIFSNNQVVGFNALSTNSALAGWITLYGVNGAVIKGNTFRYTGAKRAGIPTIISATRVTSVTAAADAAVASPPATTLTTARNPKNIVIADNTFAGFANGAYQAAPAGVIYLSSVEGAIVRGNSIDGVNSSFVTVDKSGQSIGTFGAVCLISENFINTVSTLPAIDVVGSNPLSIVGNVISGAAGGTGISVQGGGMISVVGNLIRYGGYGIRVNGCDNGLVQNNYCREYTAVGIAIGESSNAQTNFDTIVSGNRCSNGSLANTNSLQIGSKSSRTRTYGNLWREGGAVSDGGTGTTTVATDQTS